MDLLRLLPLLPLLWAGCFIVPVLDAGPGTAWAPLACDPSGATSIGQNAPPIAGLTGQDVTVAQRVAQAFQDEVTSTEPIDAWEGFARWSTATGHVQVSRSDGDDLWMLTTWRGDYPSRQVLRSALVELGAPAASLRDAEHAQAHLEQVWQGRVLSGTFAGFIKGQGDPAPRGYYGSLSLRGFVVPPGPLDAAADDEVLDTARVYDRCAMDAEGRTEAAGYAATKVSLGAFAVEHESIVRQVIIQYTQPGEPGHCGLYRGVAVDAVTGAVHGPAPLFCD